MKKPTSALPESGHFELKRLAEGVYAAIGIPGGAASGNAGIVDLGDRTIIFDTFMTAEAAGDLKAVGEHLTARPLTYVINSHAHADHWCGNQVFAAEATIIATHRTREMMPMMAGYLEQVKEDPSELERELRQAEECLGVETDPRSRATLEISIAQSRLILASLPALELRLPNLTFEGELVFRGTQRVAELVTRENGHTDSDAYLVLRDEQIAFVGDLGVFQTQPFMEDCDPVGWRAHLAELEQSSIEIFVPGHGPVGTKADLALQRQYIAIVEQSVVEAMSGRRTVEEVLHEPLPVPFDGWVNSGMSRFEGNVRSLYERLSGR